MKASGMLLLSSSIHCSANVKEGERAVNTVHIVESKQREGKSGLSWKVLSPRFHRVHLCNLIYHMLSKSGTQAIQRIDT